MLQPETPLSRPIANPSCIAALSRLQPQLSRCPAPQQAYGIADPALSWSQATGKTWSFIWSVGQNPFGALGSTATLSFAQTDAALRNMALAYLNSSMHHAVALIRGFDMLAPAGTNGHRHYVKGYLQPEQVRGARQYVTILKVGRTQLV
jgi:hypothetical protein